jgi:alkanesulfonate monooxygenase
LTQETNDIFFLNILPMNDRQIELDERALIERSVQESVRLGFRHTLVTHGHKRQDPFAVAQYGMERDPGFSPLIAVNPLYQHPLQIAKKLITLSELYPQSRIALNLIIGSFATEMKAMHDELSFADRNLRLGETYEILLDLLGPQARSNLSGRHYQLANVEIFPKWKRKEALDLFVSGSLTLEFSDAAISPYFVKNMRPLNILEKAPGPRHGLGLGICARPTQAEAEREAAILFPKDRNGEILFSLALANQATPWNQWLRTVISESPEFDADFYLQPMKSFRSAAPYLVGSYEKVALRIADFAKLGYKFFLVDYPVGDGAHVEACLHLLKNH